MLTPNGQFYGFVCAEPTGLRSFSAIREAFSPGNLPFPPRILILTQSHSHSPALEDNVAKKTSLNGNQDFRDDD